MTPVQLAAIQRPYDVSKSFSPQWQLRDSLCAAIADGSLAAEETVVVEKVAIEGYGHVVGLDEYGLEVYEPYYRDVPRTVYRVTPQVFAAWLHAQHEEPSIYVAAWFEVRGGAEDKVESPFPLADVQQLIDYRKKNSGARWKEGNQYEILLGWQGELISNRTPNVLQTMADKLGVARQRIEKIIANAEEDRKKGREEAREKALLDPSSTASGRKFG